MTITLNGTTGISTPAVTNTGAYTGDGVSFADGTPSNTLVTDTNGNVGVGTTSPTPYNSGAKLLQVNSGVANSEFKLTNSTTGNSASVGLNLIQSGNDAYVWNASNSFMSFGTNNSERMRIDSSGNLLIGRTSNPWSAKLLIESTSAGANFRTTSSTSTAVEIDVNSSGTTQKAFEVYSDSNNERSLTIWSNGNVVNKNNSYGAISDIKLKENIVDATPKLEQICQIQVRNFNYIGSEIKQIGVVAQELEQIFPSMIDESPDTDREGNLLETTTKSVKYSVFVPMLIKAVQELKAELDAVKTELATLKG